MKILGVKNLESQKLEKIPNTGDFVKIPENFRDFFGTFKSQSPRFRDSRFHTRIFLEIFDIPRIKNPDPFQLPLLTSLDKMVENRLNFAI